MTQSFQQILDPAVTADWMPTRPWACPDGELVLPVTAPREQWLAARRGLIGASDIAAIVGASAWDDAYTIWLQKTGRATDDELTRTLDRGLILEDAVIELWRRWDAGFPIEIQRRGLMRSKRFPRLGSSLDRMSVCPLGTCVIEAKTQSDVSEWEEAGEDEIPGVYQLQGAGQLLTTGRSHVHFVAMTFRFGTIHRVLWRDEPLIEHVGQVMTDWWDTHVVLDVAPTPTERALDTLRTQYGNPQPGSVAELPETQFDLLARKAAADAEYQAAKRAREAVTAEVLAAFGDATVLTIDGDPVATYSPSVTIDGATKEWRAKHAELVEPFMEPTTELDVKALVAVHPELLGPAGGLRRRRTLKMLFKS